MKLPEFRLEAFFSRWEFTARYHLTASDAQTMSLKDLLAFATPQERKRWNELTLGYIDARGTAGLRDAVAGAYESLGPESILCFAGAEEGIYCAMQTILDGDDHAIVVVPAYQSVETLALTLCQTTGVALREREGWRLDVGDVRAALRPNTKLVAINFPNNPTGAICDLETFEALIALCRERGLYLLSDEVYRGVERDGRKRLPQAADRYERALSLNVVSKSYGLPGLRAGWIACRDSAVLDAMEKRKHYLSICNSSPSEILATIAVRSREAIWNRNRERCAVNVEKLEAFFARHQTLFEFYDPDGGCVFFPRYLGAGTAEAFCGRLVERAGVLLLPPSLYASELCAMPRDRFRIGFGRDGMDEALAAFEDFLATEA